MGYNIQHEWFSCSCVHSNTDIEANVRVMVASRDTVFIDIQVKDEEMRGAISRLVVINGEHHIAEITKRRDISANYPQRQKLAVIVQYIIL